MDSPYKIKKHNPENKQSFLTGWLKMGTGLIKNGRPKNRETKYDDRLLLLICSHKTEKGIDSTRLGSNIWKELNF